MAPIFIKLRTNDGELLEVDREWVQPMGTIWNMLMLESSDSNEVIPLPKIDSMRTLELLIMWCRSTQYLPGDTEVSVGVDILRRLTCDDDEVLFKLIIAANYLDLQSLLEAGTQRLADIIHSYDNVEELRLHFNIESEAVDRTEYPIITA